MLQFCVRFQSWVVVWLHTSPLLMHCRSGNLQIQKLGGYGKPASNTNSDLLTNVSPSLVCPAMNAEDTENLSMLILSSAVYASSTSAGHIFIAASTAGSAGVFVTNMKKNLIVAKPSKSSADLRPVKNYFD